MSLEALISDVNGTLADSDEAHRMGDSRDDNAATRAAGYPIFAVRGYDSMRPVCAG